MSLRTIVVVAAGAAALAGCATGGADTVRPEGAADAKVVVGKRHFSVWFRHQDTTLVLERGRSSGPTEAIVSTLTLNALTVTAPAPYWRAAAQAVLTPLGCSVVDVRPLPDRSHWEASYACPVGTDVSHEVDAHRDVWREGILLPDPGSSGGAP